MKVWVVCDHEPLAVDPGDRKPMRAAMLCEALAAAGHETTWFISNTDHYLKRTRAVAEDGIALAPNLTVRVLAAPTYRRNISTRRLLHNAGFARAFRRIAATLPDPDVVFAALPTTEAASAAVRFAAARRIPSIVDVRDIWPDTFRTIVSRPLLAVGAPALALLDRQARLACAGATSVVAVSETYLRWAAAKGRRVDARADRVFPIGNIPNPVPDREAAAALLGRWGIPSDRRIVSFAGSWGRSHDLELVFDAASQLRDQSGIVFVLAGDSDSQPALRARLAALPNVVLTGWLGAHDMATLLSLSDIGLLPYRRGATQSLPNKVFELMSYGVYQISTLAGELAALYGRTGTGRSIEPTTGALAHSIRERLATPDLPADRAARIATFERNFRGTSIYGPMAKHIAEVADSWRVRVA